jgi:cation diffusion facilitator CzcD-associated flavoprotein CzcO
MTLERLEADVAIVGADFAGLAAAKHLTERGRTETKAYRLAGVPAREARSGAVVCCAAAIG